MKLLHLQYFRELAKRQHLYKTATELYISPSALSAAITRLEKELGVQLFDRVGRNICLNENGKKFQAHVVSILDELDTACAELRKKDEHERLLNVATSTHALWETPIAEFIRRTPGVAFNHRAMDWERLNDEAQMADYDFIITALGDIQSDNYEYTILVPDDKPVLAVYEGHPLANRKEVSLSEVRDEPFVALPKSISYRHYFDKLFEQAGIVPNIIAETDYVLRQKLIQDHMGITISTVLCSKSPFLEGLRFVPLVEPVPPRMQTLFWRKGKELSKDAKAFKNFMIAYYKNFPMDL